MVLDYNPRRFACVIGEVREGANLWGLGLPNPIFVLDLELEILIGFSINLGLS